MERSAKLETYTEGDSRLLLQQESSRSGLALLLCTDAYDESLFITILKNLKQLNLISSSISGRFNSKDDLSLPHDLGFLLRCQVPQGDVLT